jgi:hypothetical protein
MLTNCPSVYALPTNEIPTGSPNTNPMGTVICGNPEIAAGAEKEYAVEGSPFIRSMQHAGAAVIPHKASSSSSDMRVSMMDWERVVFDSAVLYSSVSKLPLA